MIFVLRLSRPRQESAKAVVENQYGFVTTSKDIMQIWDKAK
jgi:hypothetical protein